MTSPSLRPKNPSTRLPGNQYLQPCKTCTPFSPSQRGSSHWSLGHRINLPRRRSQRPLHPRTRERPPVTSVSEPRQGFLRQWDSGHGVRPSPRAGLMGVRAVSVPHPRAGPAGSPRAPGRSWDCFGKWYLGHVRDPGCSGKRLACPALSRETHGPLSCQVSSVLLFLYLRADTCWCPPCVGRALQSHLFLSLRPGAVLGDTPTNQGSFPHFCHLYAERQIPKRGPSRASPMVNGYNKKLHPIGQSRDGTQISGCQGLAEGGPVKHHSMGVRPPSGGSHVFERDGGDGCSTACVHSVPLSSALRRGSRHSR